MSKPRGEAWRAHARERALEFSSNGMITAADLLHREIIKDARIEAAQTTNKKEPE